MRTEFRTVSGIPQATGDSGVLEMSMYTNKWLQVLGTFTATLQIQVSLDGSTFFTLHANVNSAGLYEIAPTCKALKVQVSSYTSGQPIVVVGGHNLRTD